MNKFTELFRKKKTPAAPVKRIRIKPQDLKPEGVLNMPTDIVPEFRATEATIAAPATVKSVTWMAKIKMSLTKKRGSTEGGEGKLYFMSLPIADQIVFAKRLAILTKAGVPLLTALDMLKKQSTSKSTILIMSHLHQQVENGQSLSAGMEKYKKYFGAFAVNIVRVGEVSGTLNENLNYLADELKKKQELKRKIVGALVYPIFIVIATFGITILLTAYVFPKIMPVFQSFKFQLPWSTRVLIAVSGFMQHGWIYIIFGLIALGAAVYFLLRQPTVRLWFDRNSLRVPLLGPMFRTYHISNFTRTLSLLLRSDVRIVEALKIVSATIGNSAYSQKFAEIAEGVTRGEKISSLMASDPLLFPTIIGQMSEVGEMTGKLSDSLMYLSEMHEDELNNITKNLSTSIEPVLMIFMGILVGFIAISIITPIYGVTANIHP